MQQGPLELYVALVCGDLRWEQWGRGQQLRFFQKGLRYQATEQGHYLEAVGSPLGVMREVRGRIGAVL